MGGLAVALGIVTFRYSGEVFVGCCDLSGFGFERWFWVYLVWAVCVVVRD